jgi:glycosyltransferase 2 family protein
VTGVSPARSSTAPPRGFLRRHAVKLIASVVITAGIIYTLHTGGLKFVPAGGDFDHVRWWAVALYVPLQFGMSWFRCVRWRFLHRGVAALPRRRVFAVSCIGLGAVLLMPFRLGELVRPYLIRTPPDQRAAAGDRVITMTAATSSVVTERILDGLFLSLVLAIVLLLVPTIAPLPDHVVGLPITVHQVRISGYVMLGLFFAAFVTIGVYYFARGWAHRATLAVVGKLSRPLAEKLTATMEKLADGLHVFGRPRDAAGFVAETAASWGLNACGFWIVAWGCGIAHADGSSITFAEACGLMGMVGCAIVIPGPPGLLGLFQAGIFAAMTMYFPTDIVVGPGAAYVFILYMLQLVLQLALAGWGLWYEGGARSLRGFAEADRGLDAVSTGS